MRKSPKPAFRALVRAAARLRAAGWSWKAVGEKFQRSPKSVANWPSRYPEIWGKAYLKAEADLLQDAGTEARVVLQKLLRSTDERLQATAARMLFQARVREQQMRKRAQTIATTTAPAISGQPRIDEVLRMILDLATPAS